MSHYFTTMKFLVCVLCVIKFSNSVQADCDPNAPKSTSQRIRETILCGYDKNERPTFKSQKQTQVDFWLVPRYIDYEDSKDSIRLAAIIFMTWHDDNLSWSKEDYDNTSYISISSGNIWIPDFRILNSKLINNNLNTQGQTGIWVSPNGLIFYGTTTLLSVHCPAEWINWPFDIHVCNFTVTSENHMGHELDLFRKNISVDMGRYIHSHQWDILKIESLRDLKYSGEKNDSEAEYLVFMTVRFTIQRHSTVLAACYITPAILLVVFSLCLLFIEPTSSDRLIVISLMLVLQCLYLQYLAYKIPSNGDKTPKIVKFFASNLCLTAVLFIETVIVGLMSVWTSNPPWLQTVMNQIHSNQVLKVILSPTDESKKFDDSVNPDNEEGPDREVLVPDEGTVQQWKMFANVVNRLIMFAFLIFYIIFVVLCFLL